MNTGVTPIERLRSLLAFVLPLLVVASITTATRPASADVPACSAQSLRLRVETGDGRFNGMSHDGAIVVVRNVSSSACSVPGLPAFTMRDASGASVATSEPAGARFMHPGPVVLPIELEAGQVAATELRWIDNDVFDPGTARSITSKTLTTNVGGETVSVPIDATVWAKTGMPVTFDQNRLTTDLPDLGKQGPVTAGTFVGEGPAGSTYLYDSTPARKLVLRGGSSNTFEFSFDGLGDSERSPSSGSISGTLIVTHETHASFVRESIDCSLEATFYGTQLVLTQTGDCGFGNGVSAAGRYRRT